MSNLREFKNSIIQNRGASYNLINGQFNPDYGFMVSIKGKESTSNYNEGKNLQYKIADFIKQHAIILGSGIINKDYFLGAWIDNDLLYLDVSILHGTHEMAIKSAIENEQLADFDNEKKKLFIYLKNKIIMKANIEITKEYGFAYYWSLTLTDKNGQQKSFFLGQDVKFCKRVLGMEPRYIVEQIGCADLGKESTKIRLANFILKSLGLSKSELFNQEQWAICAE